MGSLDTTEELACLMTCDSTRAGAGAHGANCLPPCQRLVATAVFAKRPLLANHRIIEGFGSEGTPRGHLVQPPRSEQGHH